MEAKKIDTSLALTRGSHGIRNDTDACENLSPNR